MVTPSLGSLLTTRRAVLILTLIAILATVIPYAVVRIKAGESYSSVTPQLSNDAQRYFARANDVLRGHFFPTNPYLIEHRDEPSPTPSINDALVALPQVLGLSFNVAYYTSIFIWALAFLLLAYAVLRTWEASQLVSVLGALLAYIGVYGDMLRPGAMQIVFPLYLLFFLAFSRFVLGKDKRILPVAITAGIGFYSYVYLFMTALATIGSYFALEVLLGAWGKARKAFTAIILATIVAVPHILHVIALSHHEYYQEVMRRIVFISSRWPQIEAYYYGRWVVLLLLIAYLLHRFAPKHIHRNTLILIASLAGGVLIAMLSNIVTGRDFDIAVHVGRFGILLYLLVGAALAMPLYHYFTREDDTLLKRAVLACCALLLVTQIFLNATRTMQIFVLSKEAIVTVQSYSGVLDWLKESPEGVVVAPSGLNEYIPMLTGQYVLFDHNATLFFASDDELRKRALLYHAFDGISEEDFITHYPEYDGPSPDLYAKVSVLRHQLCSLVRDRKDCPEAQDDVAFIDVPAISHAYQSYYPGLPERIRDAYAEYNVRYVILPHEKEFPREVSTFCTLSYEDEWFRACAISTELQVL